jgi:hypothetical protein
MAQVLQSQLGSEILCVVLDRREARQVLGASAELAARRGSGMTVIGAYRRPLWWVDGLVEMAGLPVVDSIELLRDEILEFTRRLEGRTRVAWITDPGRLEVVVQALLAEGHYGQLVIAAGSRSRRAWRTSERLRGIAWGCPELDSNQRPIP